MVGRNGSGKTTLLKILCGIYRADSGKFSLDGKELADDPKLISHIGFLPDRFDYFSFYKAKDVPDFYKIIYEKFDSDYFFCQLNKNEIDPNQTIRNFSKGQKNLLGLITILASGADIILVDEVLDGMDVLNKKLILSYLLDAKEAGRTVLASSHELDYLAGICEEILYLSKDGKLKNTSQDTKNIRKVQVVVKDKLPQTLADNAVIISSLGRVKVILIKADDKLLSEYLSDDQIVQYDILGLNIEDYFYMEAGGKI
ncbi:ATP-binding cassette domain-containing protein [Anaerococcus sp. NML200537]|uniref:ATP-binding cassette domain-containing protein n=1 Tax=Anaerococcus sp. NML200537 TaxID=2954485 RepID=UPI002237E2F4|nr:ATP-binding cassette domain-containing protein [Anaerococcus sp. NML200537]MCW6700751.1 ATP-binding cassette domain-containing protein [Anaerococcus sp. NML200537]